MKTRKRSPLTGFARQLRANSSDAEIRLWWHLRDRRLGGAKFRRQYPIGPYIVDFVCLDKRLVVELDGGQHSEQVEYDAVRTMFLEREGYRVLRFWNDEVLRETEAVLEVIAKSYPHPNPLPMR